MLQLGRVRKAWFEALGVGPLLLLVAFLPSVLYVDHWAGYLTHQLAHYNQADVDEGEIAHHSPHCHLGPATCADQPPVINGRILPLAVEAPQIDMPFVVTNEAAAALDEFVAVTPHEPPWAALLST